MGKQYVKIWFWVKKSNTCYKNQISYRLDESMYVHPDLGRFIFWDPRRVIDSKKEYVKTVFQ